MNKNCLSDIIYCTTQYLPLTDKEIAILNDRLKKAIIKGINYKNKLTPCNFCKATKCLKDESCIGCEIFGEYLNKSKPSVEEIAIKLLNTSDLEENMGQPDSGMRWLTITDGERKSWLILAKAIYNLKPGEK